MRDITSSPTDQSGENKMKRLERTVEVGYRTGSTGKSSNINGNNGSETKGKVLCEYGKAKIVEDIEMRNKIKIRDNTANVQGLERDSTVKNKRKNLENTDRKDTHKEYNAVTQIIVHRYAKKPEQDKTDLYKCNTVSGDYNVYVNLEKEQLLNKVCVHNQSFAKFFLII